MRCTFTWDNGNQCKNSACVKSLSQDYQMCYYHDPEKEICGAITKDGEICNHCWITPGEKCHHHKYQEDDDLIESFSDDDPIESFSDDDLTGDEFEEQLDAMLSNKPLTSRSPNVSSQRPIVIIDLCDDDDDDNFSGVIQQEEHNNINVKEEQRPSSPTRSTPDQRLKEFNKQIAINDAADKRIRQSIKKQKADHFAKKQRFKEQLLLDYPDLLEQFGEQLKKDYPDLFNNF